MTRTRHIFFLLLGITSLAAAQDQAPDPWRQATLYRDEWGVPHIYAETQTALGFAFGYAQAQDHLTDMLLAYRMANGRAAEVLGEAYAESDAFSIKMGHADLAAEAWNNTVDETTAALCTGFAQGVNLWIIEHPDQCPAWAEGVQAKDILALWHAYLMSMAPLDTPDVWRRDPAENSGNAWALSPERNESGATLLAINPHQHYNGFFRHYEAHLIMPGYNMYGATLYGLPVLLQGHNGLLGWALTPNRPDTADVYKEPITEAAKDPSQLGNQIAAIPQRAGVMLEYASRARPYFVLTAGGLEERSVPQWIVERGPVVEAGADFFHTWRIGGYRNFGGLAQLFFMGGATSLEDFQQALTAQQLPCFHITYADRAGNLFYLYNAVTGVRDAYTQIPLQDGAEPFNWKSPVPPFNDHLLWGSVFAPGELPYLQNPKSGYIQACGNPPWTVTDDPPYAAESWPFWLVEDVDTYRAQHVRERLRSGLRNFQDMQNMLYDDLLPAAKDMCILLIAAADANEEFVKSAHPDLAAFLDALRNWNYRAETNTSAMTYYHLWWAMLRAQNPFGLDANAPLYQAIAQNTPETQQTILQAAADAVRLLRNQYDTLEIPWGDVHRVVRGNEDIPMPGSDSGEAIFVSSDYAYKDDRWQVTYGYGFAMAVEFSDPPRAVSIVPFGASESPTSPHYADQLELFTKKQFKKTYFLMEDVTRNAEQAFGASLTLYPKGVDGALYILANRAVDATLKTVADAPVPLPEGIAAFSLFVQPKLTPSPEEVLFQYDVRISEALCTPENLNQLSLYAYSDGRGWTQFEEQTLDADLHVISGRHPYAAAFAVLGPKEILLTSFAPVEATSPSLSPAPSDPSDLSDLSDSSTPSDLPPQPLPTDPPRTFNFIRHDLPEGTTTQDTLDGKGGSIIMGSTGQRTFVFERHDKPAPSPNPENPVENSPSPSDPPSAILNVESPSPQPDPSDPTAPADPLPNPPHPVNPVENSPSPPVPDDDAPPPEGPTGKRQFYFKRHD